MLRNDGALFLGRLIDRGSVHVVHFRVNFERARLARFNEQFTSERKIVINPASLTNGRAFYLAGGFFA